MAANLTTQGVSSSANEGLTTLAGKILDIQGGGGGGGGSTLFEDKCNSSSGLSNYGSSVLIRGSNATITMTYNSTENAYQVTGTGNYHAMVPIPDLDDEDEYTIEADIKGQSQRFNAIGFYLDNRNDTTSYGDGFYIQTYDQKLVERQFRVSSDGTEHTTSVSLSASQYYHLKVTVDGTSLTGELYNGNTLIASLTNTVTINNKQLGIFLFCENGSPNSVCYIKNIKAVKLGSGSDCTQYQTEISNAIEYINGSGS